MLWVVLPIMCSEGLTFCLFVCFFVCFFFGGGGGEGVYD